MSTLTFVRPRVSDLAFSSEEKGMHDKEDAVFEGALRQNGIELPPGLSCEEYLILAKKRKHFIIKASRALFGCSIDQLGDYLNYYGPPLRIVAYQTH
jgi:hypothetical protein